MRDSNERLNTVYSAGEKDILSESVAKDEQKSDKRTIWQ
jgi:hypothetical protein